MNIEERAKDDLIWLKDNWVVDWAEPEQSRFKFAIEDILKVLDFKNKQIEELKDVLANERLNKKTDKDILVKELKRQLSNQDKVILLMTNEIMFIRLNDKYGFLKDVSIADKANAIKEYFENEAKRLV